MTVASRRIGVSDPAHLPPCARCKAGERHDFLVTFIPDEGMRWQRTFHAIGPREARFLAEQHIAGEPFDSSIYLQHAPESETPVLDVLADPADPDAVGADPIDEWKALRDAGLAESELRYLGGDR